MVLGSDLRQRIRLVAPALEIAPRDLAENSGKAALDIGFLANIGRLQKVAADFGGRHCGHLLDADDEHDARRFGRDGFQSLMHGGGTGRAGILYPGRALEAQIGRGLQHQRGGEILRREAGIEVAEHDLIDIARFDPGIGNRLARHFDDQAFDRFAGELAERCMRPAHDARGHNCSLWLS
jgi:hypothetical protein